MSTENTTGKDQQKRQVLLQKIYVKDLSFESPRPLESLLKPIERPDVNFQLNTESRKVEEGAYEVMLTITVTVSKENSTTVSIDQENTTTFYLIEVKQAGLFTLKGFSEQELAPMLNSYCPNILFPYVREVVSSMVERGGFPQLLLKPVNFDALYKQHMEQQSHRTAPDAVASTE